LKANPEVYCGYKEVSSLLRGMPSYEVAKFTADIKRVFHAPKGRFSYAVIHDANGVAIAWDGAWVPASVWFKPQMMEGLVRVARAIYIGPEAKKKALERYPEWFGFRSPLVENLFKKGILYGPREFLEELWREFRDRHPTPYVLSVYQPFEKDEQYCLEKVDERDVTTMFAAFVVNW